MQQLKNLLQRHKVWVVLASVLLAFLLVLVALPAVISYQFKIWVTENGGENVSIENVDFNPFTAKLVLQGVTIERSGSHALELPYLYLQTHWSDLFGQVATFTSLEVNGLNLVIDQSETLKSHVGGILFSRLTSSAETEADPQTANAWEFKVNEFKLTGSQLTYLRSGLETTVKIDQFSLRELDSTNKTSDADISISGSLDGASYAISGELTAFDSTPDFKGTLKIEQLAVERFTAIIDAAKPLKGLKLSVNSNIHVDNIAADTYQLKHSGDIVLQDYAWVQQDAQVKGHAANWKGDLSAQIHTAGDTSLNLGGKIDLQQMSLNADGNKVDIKALGWDGNLKTTLKQDDAVKLAVNGKLAVKALAVNQDQQLDLASDAIDWSGNLETTLGKDSSTRLSMSAEISVSSLAVKQPQQQIDLSGDAINWKGKVDLHNRQDAVEISTTADASVAGLKLARLDNQRELLSFSQLDLQGMTLNKDKTFQLAELVLSDFGLARQIADGDKVKALLQYQSLNAKNINLKNQQSLYIEEIHQQGMHGTIARNKEGGWSFDTLLEDFNQFTAPGEAEPTEADPSQQAAEPFAIEIGQLTTSANSDIRYADASLAQPFEQTLQIDEFTISGIKNNDAANDSQVKLKARLDEKSTLDVSGTARLFATDPEFDLKARVEALSLLPYSQFIESAIGYQVDSGSLNAEGSFVAQDKALSSDTELVLNGLEIKPLSEERLKALKVEIDSGIETGLSMLRNKNQTIKFTLPVKGPFAELEVDPGDIINQAMGSALKTGAKTYLAAALFPFGTLLVIADVATDKAMQVRLDPVLFDAGSAKLLDERTAYLDKVANVLDEKPEINVKICGVSVTADRTVFSEQQRQQFEKTRAQQQASKDSETKQQEAKDTEFQLDEKLINTQMDQLARQRAEVVYRYFSKQKSVKASRLVDCQPRLETDDKEAKPRADLEL